jgi:MFS family permease
MLIVDLPPFREDFGVLYDEKYIIPAKWLALWDGANPLGMVFGSIFAGWFQDRFGRKPSLAIGTFASAIGILVIWCCQYPAGTEARCGLFMFGKVFTGITCGIILATSQTYASENLPSVLRGPVVAFFPIAYLFGQLLSAVVVLGVDPIEGKKAYELAIISMWPFSAIPIIVSLIIPESPVHHVRKGRLELAAKTQARLSTAQDNIPARIEEIQVILQHEAEQAASDARTTYWECFRGTDRRRTLLAFFAAALPQLFGLSLLGQGAYFLQIGGMGGRNSFLIVISAIATSIAAQFANVNLLTRFGRRTLCLASMVPIIFGWLVVGICGTVQNSVSVW